MEQELQQQSTAADLKRPTKVAVYYRREPDTDLSDDTDRVEFLSTPLSQCDFEGMYDKAQLLSEMGGEVPVSVRDGLQEKGVVLECMRLKLPEACLAPST